MAKTGKLFFWVYFLLNIVGLSLAYAVSLETQINQRTISVGDVFSIQVNVKQEGGKLSKVSISGSDRPGNAKISYLRESRGTSVNTSIINGSISMTKAVNLSLIYHAQEAGEVKIPHIWVNVNGKKHKAPGLKFKIYKKGTSTQGRGSQGSSPFDQMESLFSKFFEEGFGRFGKGVFGEDLDFFIDVEVSNMNPYFGEQFVVQWYLYTNGRITDIDTLKYPSLEGFWKEEIELAVSLRGEPVQKNGATYTRYMLASYAITPVVKDKAIIDPYKVKCNLMGLGQLFRSKSEEFVRQSDEAILRIKNLPTSNQPDDFVGAVGDFNLAGYVQSTNVKAGEPFNYKLKIGGIGQAKFVELPDLDFGPNFEVYDISESSNFVKPDRTEKTYNILLIAKNREAKKIPSFSMSFFNAQTEEYYRMSTKEIELRVAAGETATSEVVSPFETSGQNDSSFVPSFYKNFSLETANFNAAKNFKIYTALYFLSVLGLLVFLAWQYIGSKKTYSFEKDLSQRFENLLASVDDGHWREASTLAVNILYFYVYAQSKNPPKGQGLDQMLAALPSSLRRKVDKVLKDLNNDLQKYSFAPKSLVEKGDEKAQVKEKCLALQGLLEGSLKDESSQVGPA